MFPLDTLTSIFHDESDDSTPLNIKAKASEPAAETVYGVPVSVLADNAPKSRFADEDDGAKVEVDESEAPTELWTRPNRDEWAYCW